MITIDTACLFSLLVGQWLQFWLVWRMYLSVAEVLVSMKEAKTYKPPFKEIGMIPPEITSDKETGKSNLHRRL